MLGHGLHVVAVFRYASHSYDWMCLPGGHCRYLMPLLFPVVSETVFDSTESHQLSLSRSYLRPVITRWEPSGNPLLELIQQLTPLASSLAWIAHFPGFQVPIERPNSTAAGSGTGKVERWVACSSNFHHLPPITRGDRSRISGSLPGASASSSMRMKRRLERRDQRPRSRVGMAWLVIAAGANGFSPPPQ